MEAFKGDGHAKIADFCAAWADEMSGKNAQFVLDMGEAIMDTTGKTRFSMLFDANEGLTQKQADQLITEVRKEPGQGWRKTFEQLAGFEFRVPNVPSHQDLAGAFNAGAYEEDDGMDPPAKRPRRGEGTISFELNALGTLRDQVVEEACFAVIETAHPLVDSITEPDVERFTDAVMCSLAKSYGRINIGTALARHLGAQIAKALPNLPDYGEVPGFKRKWWKMLLAKSGNRKHKDYKAKLELVGSELTEEVKPFFDKKLSGIFSLVDAKLPLAVEQAPEAAELHAAASNEPNLVPTGSDGSKPIECQGAILFGTSDALAPRSHASANTVSTPSSPAFLASPHCAWFACLLRTNLTRVPMRHQMALNRRQMNCRQLFRHHLAPLLIRQQSCSRRSRSNAPSRQPRLLPLLRRRPPTGLLSVSKKLL